MSTNHATRTSSKKDRFLALYLPARKRLEAYTRAMAKNAEEAKELVSDTVLAAYEGLEQLNNDAAFPAWLLAIASRLYARQFRRAKFFGVFSTEQSETIPDPRATPETAADTMLLYQALARLPEKQREAVILFELADMPLEVVQEIQGGSLSGVKSRIVRGRAKLATLLGVPNRGRPQTNSPPANGITIHDRIQGSSPLAYHTGHENE